jgi:hypothetical protein
MTAKERRQDLEDNHPELIIMDGFDEAIIGVAYGWFNQSRSEAVCYDMDRCIEILVAEGLSDEEAFEHLDYNCLGAYVGEHTPVFLERSYARENQ